MNRRQNELAENLDANSDSVYSMNSESGFLAKSDSNEEEKQEQQRNSLSAGINFNKRMPSLRKAT